MGLTKRITPCECDDTPSLEQQFQEIMEYFDFSHVHMMMEWEYSRVDYDDDGNHLGYHQWKTYNGNVPTIPELKKDAEKLLKEIIKLAKVNPRYRFLSVSTGAFKASYRYGIIELECVFENWSCD